MHHATVPAPHCRQATHPNGVGPKQPVTNSRAHGPLRGAPMGLKDIIDVAGVVTPRRGLPAAGGACLRADAAGAGGGPGGLRRAERGRTARRWGVGEHPPSRRAAQWLGGPMAWCLVGRWAGGFSVRRRAPLGHTPARSRSASARSRGAIVWFQRFSGMAATFLAGTLKLILRFSEAGSMSG
ncbi:hypothetical protein GCM10010389_33310 [Streptomyces echinoruber]|uniref:Uncharacterized protein n=1 Tax=Streptomyces echinoruber TaxID=68898 RepID=A0A918RB66_9ACTN|nr:hypothetical protein GCM10010389_33310 [Streptomyces echinoruber]